MASNEMDNFTDHFSVIDRVELRHPLPMFNKEVEIFNICSLQKNDHCLIARVIWMSELDEDDDGTTTLDFTLVDVNGEEIGGKAHGEVALSFNENLQQGNIYRFPLATITKQARNSRLAHKQTKELVFPKTVVCLLSNAPVDYPDVKWDQCRQDYRNVQMQQVVSIIGVVLRVYCLSDGTNHMLLVNWEGHYIQVKLESDKVKELNKLENIRRRAVLGIYGVKKTENLSSSMIRSDYPCEALFETFYDTIFRVNPVCPKTEKITTWRNLVVTDDEPLIVEINRPTWVVLGSAGRAGNGGRMGRDGVETSPASPSSSTASYGRRNRSTSGSEWQGRKKLRNS